MIKKIILSFVLLALLTGASVVGLFYYGNKILNERHLVKDQVIVISPGQSFGAISRELFQADLVKHPKVLQWYARVKGLAVQVKAGEYQLSGSISALDVLAHLIEGDTLSYRVTLVEGKRLIDWLELLWAQPKIKPTLASEASVEDPGHQALYKKVSQILAIEEGSPEGWFYPDTYAYTKGATDLDLLKRAHRKMKQVLSEEWSKRGHKLPIATPYEALTLASIIEKETGVAHERPEIAGVFIRRLRKKMRLETDPTVIYGLGPTYNGNITRKHLKQKTPYNTYQIKGLPPSPIAMPSGASIHAALNPKKGKTIFFVAKGDGTHQFSTTLTDHNKAVRKYQLKRRKNYRSSPSK